MAAAKYYVVWKGRRRGVFSSWQDCERQVKGFVGAEYKAFGTLDEARTAFGRRYEDYRGRPASVGKWTSARTKPELPSLCVDAACSGVTGRLEYRGVETANGRVIFRAGPFADGTNNVGEFLAIVDGLKWLREHRLRWPVYSDSENAIIWVRARRCRTKLARTAANRRLFELIAAAESDLRAHDLDGAADALPVSKWDTRAWGEIPADFGRK